MDQHKRFMQQRTAEVKHLLRKNKENLDLSTNLVRSFHHRVENSDKFTNSLEIFETLRAIFCLFYKYTTNSVNPNNKTTVRIRQIMILFGKLNVDKTESMLDNQLKETKHSLGPKVSVVLDILVLHMTLYSKVPEILKNLERLQNLIRQHLEKHKELTIFHTMLMQCYIDSLLLHKRRASIVGESESEEVKALYLQNVELCLKLDTRKECDLLTVILPKLMKVVTAGEMLATVWKMLFTLIKDPAKTLAILHATADLWFPITSKQVKELLDQSLEERLWLLLHKGLSSPINNERRQALQLVKRVVDFTDQYENQASQFHSYQEIRPLVCIGNDSERDSFKKNLNTWLSVLEEMKKDEKHCVTSLFSLLRNLVKETVETQSIHIAWIRCAFLQILRDNNNAMVKWGLLEVLTLNLELYDDEFLDAVLDALNNTSLYEVDANEEKPTLVKELTIFLNHAESQNTDLVTRFMVQASKKTTWYPVPLFQIIHALSMVGKVQTVWKAAELEAVKSLAEVILTIQCPILRIGSQIELLEAMTHFATEPLDLPAVSNTLAAFPTSETLIRDQLAWKRISTWLSKTVKETEAISFLESVCRLMGNDISVRDLSMKSLSLIIMLFYDGYLALNSKVSPGFTALRNLLHCLNEEGSKSRPNAKLKIRAIELLGCLLDFSMLKDCILNELISDYANATLRWTFKNLRTILDESAFKDMSTYVRITQQLFMANSSIITKRDLLNHIKKFQSESRNIIEDGEFTSNMKRVFGVKILHTCLKATSTRLRNYKFIESLYKTYKDPILQSSEDAKDDGKSHGETGNHKYEMESEYHKIVAAIFHEYLKDEPVEEWLPEINQIKEVLYLIQVGGQGIVVPLVGILSQIFYKGAVGGATHIDDFTSAVRLCWKSIIESNKCSSATEEILDLMFSSAFLDCKETRELTIECTREITVEANEISAISIVLLKRLEKVNEKYLCNFYEALLACLLRGTVPSCDQKIELQARSYVLDCYQEAYPNYLSAMNSSTSFAARAHAVTLLHKMITNDPAHAVELLPLIVAQLEESQKEQDVRDSQTHSFKTRILQVLLVLQPILNNGDIESIHTLLCNAILSESSQPSVRIMHEWLLIRIYLGSEHWSSKIWDLFDQCEERRVSSLCSAMGVAYHVARLLSSDSQLDFMNRALQRIMPYCMSQQSNVRLYAQVIATKLYSLATELSYSAITEKYRVLQDALVVSRKHGDLLRNSAEVEDNFYFKTFDPINDYTLQTLFHELPILTNVPSDEPITTQMFEKAGFKKVHNHPLKLMDRKNDTQPQRQMIFSAADSVPTKSRKICLEEANSTLES